MAAQFKSVGASATRAIAELMIRRDAEKRQAMVDSLLQSDRMREQARQDMAAQRAAQLAKQEDADRAAAIHGPQSDLSPEVAATLRAGGYQVNDHAALAARTVAMPIVAPVDPLETAARRGQLLRAAMGYGPKVAAQDLSSQAHSRRGETHTESLARGQREAVQAERDEARRFRDEQAGEDRAFRGEQAGLSRQAAAEKAEADRELRLAIAQMSASNNFETRALGAQLKELQIAAERERLDNSRRERDTAAKEKALGRATVRDLAQSLIDDPALGSITGAIEGRRDTFIGSENVDALRRFTQLKDLLSLEGRAKLKGQGAVSDFEGRMLAGAMSALDRAAGPDAVKKHLGAIVQVFSDDAPDSGGGNEGAVVRWGRDANGRPVRLR